jgi:hypothetical protein
MCARIIVAHYYSTHREKVDTNTRFYRLANPEKVISWPSSTPENGRIRSNLYAARNRAKLAEKGRRNYWDDPETGRERSIRSQKRHPETRAAYEARPIVREKRKTKAVRYRAANPDKVQAQGAKRRAAEANPSWTDQKAIAAIFAARPPGHHVDHIVPLRGRTAEGYRISGLHVPGNLTYRPASANLRKYNRMTPEEQALCETTPLFQ